MIGLPQGGFVEARLAPVSWKSMLIRVQGSGFKIWG